MKKQFSDCAKKFFSTSDYIEEVNLNFRVTVNAREAGNDIKKMIVAILSCVASCNIPNVVLQLSLAVPLHLISLCTFLHSPDSMCDQETFLLSAETDLTHILSQHNTNCAVAQCSLYPSGI